MAARIALQIGDVIGNYRIVRRLGAGGMGVVYEVVHLRLERRAALKVLTFAGADTELATRFVNEGRAANVTNQAGIVQIYEYGQLDDGAPWLLMEYIEGQTLEARLAAVRTGVEGASIDPLSVLYQLAATLSAVHKQGVVHRDLKPTNIILTPDLTRPEGEQVKLLDFGIAKLMGDNLRSLPDGRRAAPETLIGTFLGTAHYMAPEQCRSAADVDAKADVYALGVIAYELLSGRLPFEGEAISIVMQKCTQPPPPLAANGQPPELVALVTAMLHFSAAERPTMSQVAELLARLGGRGLSGAQVRKLVSVTAEHSGFAKVPYSRPPRRILMGSLGILTGAIAALIILLAGDTYLSSGVKKLLSIQAPSNPVGTAAASPADLGNAVTTLPPPPEGPTDPPPEDDTVPAEVDLAESAPVDMGTNLPDAVVRPQEPPGPVCVPRLLRESCVAALSEPQKKAFQNAAEKVGFRICPGRRLLLMHPVKGFLRCQPAPGLPAGFCDRFISTLDALWEPSWPLPAVVEIKCPTK